jgi:hypothetical protein
MQCPKCGSGVAAHLTSCPICFADMEEVGREQGPSSYQVPKAGIPHEDEYMPKVGIPGLDNHPAVEAPPPNYLSPGIGAAPAMGGGEVRVSLTGEVMEVMTPTPRNVSAGAPMPPMPGARPPVGTRPAPGRLAPGRKSPVRTNYPDEEGYQKEKAGPVAAIMLVLILVCGAAYGGWYWYNNRTNPKDQAVKLGAALKAKNWGDIFDLCAWPPDKVASNSRSEFITGADKGFDKAASLAGPEAAAMAKQAVATLETVSGEPTANADGTDVPVTNKMTLGGITVSLKGVAHMVRQGGIWKLNMLQFDPKDPSTVQTAFKEFIGQPEGMGGMGGNMGGGRGRR